MLRCSGLTLKGFRRLAATRFASSASIVTERTDSLLVNWYPEKRSWSRFHYLWLRDNCHCPKCRHPVTGQRSLSSLLTNAEDTEPDRVQPDDVNEQVKVEWRDGHVSQFKHSWLLENSYCHHNIDDSKVAVVEKATQILWDAEYFKNRELPSVDYREYMKSDKVLLKMLQNFRQYGFCFMHNTPISEEATYDAIRRIGPLKRTYYGDTWSMTAGSMAVNDLAYSTGKIEMHTDNIFFTEAPGLLAFHCTEYSGQGGESLLVDGFSVAKHIRQTHPKYFSLLTKVSIPFEVEYKDGFYRTRKSFFRTSHEGEVTQVNYNGFDRKPFDVQSTDEMQSVLGCGPDEAMVSYYKAMYCLQDLLYGGKFLYELKLSPGTLLAFNNHRLLHGRKAFKGHRKLCGTSINCQEWESKLKVLERGTVEVT